MINDRAQFKAALRRYLTAHFFILLVDLWCLKVTYNLVTNHTVS